MRRLVALVVTVIILLSVTSAHTETTLTLWCIAVEGDSLRAAYIDAIATVEAAHPGLRIEWTAYENETYKIRLRSAMANPETMPDIFFTWSDNSFGTFVANGGVYCLDDTLPDYKAELTDTVLANSTYNGRHYGVPLTMNVVTMFANMDMLHEVGYETVPETYDELMILCDKLVKAGKIPFGVAGKEGWCLSEYLEPLIEKTIGSEGLKNCYTGVESWNQPGIFSAVEKFIELKQYFDPNAAALGNEEVKQNFINGRYAFYQNGSWNCTEIANRANFTVRACAFPVVDNDKSSLYQLIGGTNDTLAVTANTADPELCAEVAFELSRIISREGFLNNAQFPAWAVNYDTSNCDYLSNQIAEMIAQSDGMVLYGDNIMSPDETNAYLDNIVQVFEGDIDSTEFVENMSDETIYGGSGMCGDNVRWELDDKGTLTISGFGAMENYGEDPVGKWHYDRLGAVKTIIVEDGITSIGDYAFAYCREATSITVPDSVTQIGTGAFRDTKISNIELPDNLESIGAYAFADCSYLNSIAIPDTVTALDDYLFAFCVRLENIEFPGNLETIGDYVFQNCSCLSNIVIPDGVTSLGEKVFINCSDLASITFPDSLVSIGEQAFMNCTSLTTVTIPGNSTVGSGAFCGCSSLESIQVAADNRYYISLNGILFTRNMKTLIQYPAGKKAETVMVPYGVITVGNNAFNGIGSLKSIILPESVVIIGKEAFRNCSNLARVSMPQSIQSIGSQAFYKNTRLAEVYYSGTEVDRIMINTDYGNDSLENAVWHYESTLSTIASGQCGNNLDWTLDVNGMLTISGEGEMPDFDCEEPAPWHEYSDNIISVMICNGVTSVGSSAFYEYENLATVTMADSVIFIGNEAFLRCESLTEVQLSNELVEIGSAAFSECPLLSSITLPGKLRTFGMGVFAFSGLSRVVIPSGVESQTCDFFYPSDDGGPYLYHIILPASVTDMGYGTFCHTMLPHDNPDFVLPSELRIIETQAFDGIKARFVWFADNVETVGESVLANCDDLRYVYIPSNCEVIGANAFPKGTVIVGISGNENPCEAEIYATTNGYQFVNLEDPFAGNG